MCFLPACGGSRVVDNESKGGQFVWLPHLVQAVLGAGGLSDALAQATGLGPVHHGDHWEGRSLWPVL